MGLDDGNGIRSDSQKKSIIDLDKAGEISVMVSMISFFPNVRSTLTCCPSQIWERRRKILYFRSF